MGVDSGHCLSKQENRFSKPKTEFFEQLIHLCASMTKPHLFSKTIPKYGAAHQTIYKLAWTVT